MYIKIKEIYQEIKQINEDSIDSIPRRKFRDDLEERDHPNSYQFEKFINEIHTGFSNLVNKYYYVNK